MVTSLERVEADEEDGEDSEGEGTGSTELSDIRLLGRCGRETRAERQFMFCSYCRSGRFMFDIKGLRCQENIKLPFGFFRLRSGGWKHD